MNLSDSELKQIKGGGVGFGVFIGIGALITFVAGIIDGFTRPIKCNK